MTSESRGRNPSLFPQAFREPVLRFMVPHSIPVSWPDRLIGEFSAYFKGPVAVSSGVSPFREPSIHPSFLNNACELAITHACDKRIEIHNCNMYLLFLSRQDILVNNMSIYTHTGIGIHYTQDEFSETSNIDRSKTEFLNTA